MEIFREIASPGAVDYHPVVTPVRDGSAGATWRQVFFAMRLRMIYPNAEIFIISMSFLL